MRASVETEKLGVPSSSVICEGFVGQGASTGAGLGMPNVPIAMVPGHVDTKSKEQLAEDVKTVTLDMIVKQLTTQPAEAKGPAEPGLKDIIFKGTFEEVNKYFYANKYSDGLPIVPPTVEKVEEFLKFTDRSPDEKISVLLPDNREATVWNVAVNGVMAGCRPEYMPVLLALAEAMADPKYGVEHSGNTPGSETLITLNGPIIKDLGFNYEQGVLRDGIQPNTTVGRFWRLFLRNVAGFLHGTTDKGTYGGTWKVVEAENEDVEAKIGWQPLSVDMGFKAGDNVVTISRMVGSEIICSIFGSKPEEMLPFISDRVANIMGLEMLFTVSPENACSNKPHLQLTPVLAETIAKAGWSKKDVQQYLFDHARIPAWKAEKLVNDWTNFVAPHQSLCDVVNKTSKIPKVFCESTDPNRMVPVVCKPDDLLITVTGDPMRTNAQIFGSNGILGYTVSKPIKLPANWSTLLKEAKGQ